MDIQVEWTGTYPCLCFGKWLITIDGIPLTGLDSDSFNTLGTYSSWHFEDWSEVFEDHEAGLLFEEWKLNPPNNLKESLGIHGFTVDDDLLIELYKAIQLEDWRHGSCGGCI